MAFVDQNTILI